MIRGMLTRKRQGWTAAGRQRFSFCRADQLDKIEDSSPKSRAGAALQILSIPLASNAGHAFESPLARLRSLRKRLISFPNSRAVA
jgi:hypothetical protein